MNNLFMIAVGLLIVAVAYLYYEKHTQPVAQQIEGFTDIAVVESCKDITPDKLLESFDYDVDRLSAVLVSLDIPAKALREVSNYPKIASLLISKGLLKEEKCT